jgi:hypothetical protein
LEEKQRRGLGLLGLLGSIRGSSNDSLFGMDTPDSAANEAMHLTTQNFQELILARNRQVRERRRAVRRACRRGVGACLFAK